MPRKCNLNTVLYFGLVCFRIDIISGTPNGYCLTTAAALADDLDPLVQSVLSFYFLGVQP